MYSFTSSPPPFFYFWLLLFDTSCVLFFCRNSVKIGVVILHLRLIFTRNFLLCFHVSFCHHHFRFLLLIFLISFSSLIPQLFLCFFYVFFFFTFLFESFKINRFFFLSFNCSFFLINHVSVHFIISPLSYPFHFSFHLRYCSLSESINKIWIRVRNAHILSVRY